MGETASAAGKYYFLKDEKSYLHSILSREALFTFAFFFLFPFEPLYNMCSVTVLLVTYVIS